MGRHYTKNAYQRLGRGEALGVQRAEVESETPTEKKQSPPQITQQKPPKPKEKIKHLYHWSHTKGSHHGVIEGFYAENDKEAKRIVEAATSADRWHKPWRKPYPDFDEYIKHRGDGRSRDYENQEFITLSKCPGVRCGTCSP